MTRLLERFRYRGREYAAAVLLNFALVQAVLTPPAGRTVARVRVVVLDGPFLPTELLRDERGTVVGVLAQPLDGARKPTTIVAN